MNSTAQLHNAQSLLQDLGNALSNLVNASPEIFTDEQIQRCLQDFQAAYQEAAQRLAHPSLVIATLGTTSSGKSTIVNALMGRRIAPIEAGEMSGGILHLKHSEERRLVVEETPGAVWETGEWSDLGDAELYARIQTVMNAYHQERRKRDLMAPQVRVQVPLLPARDLKLSGLPEGVEIEFLDLPGLKSVQDRANLAVIQEQMGKAFSLVALDYMQVDEQHRQKLLGELRQVVEYLGGRTDAVIFILNRVDLQTANNIPLEVRISQLQVEIQTILGLEHLPSVIPFSAISLFYTQCAWGTSPLDSVPEVDADDRTRFLKHFFKDCASLLEKKKEDDLDLEDWLDDLKKKVRRNQGTSDEELKQLLHYALEWSGGLEFWQCVRTRLAESFASLVIAPALLPLSSPFQSLSTSLDLLLSSRKIQNVKAVEQKLQEVNQIRQYLMEQAQQVSSEFKDDLKEILNDLDTRKQVSEQLQKKGYEFVVPLSKIVRDLKKDLTSNLIAVVCDAFEEGTPVFKLKENLEDVVAPHLAEDIVRSYDEVEKRMRKFSKHGEFLSRQVKADDVEAIKGLERDEKVFRLLYRSMREAIMARANFFLQTRMKEISQGLLDLVGIFLNLLQEFLESTDLGSHELKEAIIADLRKSCSQEFQGLPDGIFTIEASSAQQSSQTKQEVVGTRTYTVYVDKIRYDKKQETYQEGSCFKESKTRTVSVPVTYKTTEEKVIDRYDDVNYRELILPSPEVMGNEWLEGIDKNTDQLCGVISEWITDQIDQLQKLFEKSINDITDFAERTLDNRLALTEAEFKEQEKYLQLVERTKDIFCSSYLTLENSIKSKHQNS